VVSELLDVLRTRPDGLVPFQAIQRQLKLSHMIDRGIQEVPLSAITGSINRTQDFDRAFLPRNESLHPGLRRIRELAESEGFPPVELYRVGNAYFVVDGHHRISVARTMDAGTIEARVREFPSKVDIGPDDSLESILAKAGAHNFQQATGLDASPFGEFQLSSPVGWDRLLKHIAVHQYYLGVMHDRAHEWPEAVDSWLTTVYRPIVQVIRDKGLLADFPQRTETDLYLWIIHRLHYLRREYGDDGLGPEVALPKTSWWRRWWRQGKSALARRDASTR